jgi:hypothetical protein
MNPSGAIHCFLNAVVQATRRVKPFRLGLQQLPVSSTSNQRSVGSTGREGGRKEAGSTE